jgi:hypothetical protein
MTNNPLLDARKTDGWIGENPGFSVEELRQWCAERNAWRVSKALDWFYVVRTVDGQSFVDKITGWRAVELREQAAGRRVRWFTPGPGEIREIEQRIAQMRRDDPRLTQQGFNAMIDRGMVR